MVPPRHTPYPVLMSAPPDRPPIQVFGRDDSASTRAAIRYFKERRLAVTYANLRVRPMAAGELRRFVERLGARACADTDGRPWRDAGLGYMSMDDAELADRLLADQRLLRLPLVRDGNRFSAGQAEQTWKEWLAAAPGTAGGGSGAGSRPTEGARR
jgi:arsenate reductase (glutaredoxin)